MGRFEELQKPWMQDMADQEAGKEVDHNHLRYRFAEAQAALEDFRDEEDWFGEGFAEEAKNKVLKEAANEAYRLNETFESKKQDAIKAMQRLMHFEKSDEKQDPKQHQKLLAQAGKSIENFRNFRQKKVNSQKELSFESVWAEVIDVITETGSDQPA